MKTKLEVGKEYWLDGAKDESGIFVGLDGKTLLFKQGKNCKSYGVNETGYLPFLDIGREYCEVQEEKQWQFTTPIAMRCTEEQLNGIKDKLVEMGYRLSDSKYGEGWLCTNHNAVKDLFSMSSCTVNQPMVFNLFNPGLFLAIAAMTDKEDGINGEWWRCDDTMLKQHRGTFNKKYCWRKATAQEIIVHFEKKEFVLPENWRVKITKENYSVFNRRFYNSVIGSWLLFSGHFNHQAALPHGCTEITFEQFERYVLGIHRKISKNEVYAWGDILELFNVEYKTSLSKSDNYHFKPMDVSFMREYHPEKAVQKTPPSCPKTPVVGSIEYTVNVEFDAEKAAEELFTKIVEFWKSSPPAYKFIPEGWSINDKKEVVVLENKTTIHIPPTKQATIFDDRVEITDWKPKEGDYVWVIKTSTGEYSYDHIMYKKRDYIFFNNGFIKRTESEAKQLVEKLKQAML